jgi:hypothetical protein
MKTSIIIQYFSIYSTLVQTSEDLMKIASTNFTENGWYFSMSWCMIHWVWRVDGAVSGVTKRRHFSSVDIAPWKRLCTFFYRINSSVMWKSDEISRALHDGISFDKILPKQVGCFGTRINWKPYKMIIRRATSQFSLAGCSLVSNTCLGKKSWKQ